MPTNPRRLIVQNAINLERLSNSIARDNDGVLRALFDEIVALLVKHDPTAVSAMTYRRDRLDKLLRKVRDIVPEYFGDIHKSTRAELARLGAQQGKQAAEILIASVGQQARVSLGGPTVNMMKAILDRNPFVGETLKGWSEVQAEGVVRRVRQQVQIGMSGEESIDDMVRRIRGKSNGRGGYTGGVMETTTREARAVVRTAVTEVANEAAITTYEQNARVVAYLEIVNSLDSRTCPVCILNGGKRYPVDKARGNLPAYHMQCRCFHVAVPDWERLGMEPPKEGTRAARDANGKTIQVSASTDYDSWLRGQPLKVQREVLGHSRADLFRSGKADIAGLIRSDGRFLTLDELEGR